MADWLSLLTASAQDPAVYLPLLFVFSILSTIALPIPEEVGLLNPFLPPVALVLVMAAGKAVGAAMVFPFGERVGDALRRRTAGSPRLERLRAWVDRVVARWGYGALFGLLSVPLMTDTMPIYAFAVANPEVAEGEGSGRRARKALRFGPFVAVCFAAGLVRCTAFLALPLWLGWP